MTHFDSHLVQVEIFNLNEGDVAAVFVNGVPARHGKGRFVSKMSDEAELKALASIAGEQFRPDDLRFSYYDIADELKESGGQVEEALNDYKLCSHFKVSASPAMNAIHVDAFRRIAPNW